MGEHNSSSIAMSKQPVLQSVQAIVTAETEQKPDKNGLEKIDERKSAKTAECRGSEWTCTFTSTNDV
jgi:hypothetical protein